MKASLRDAWPTLRVGLTIRLSWALAALLLSQVPAGAQGVTALTDKDRAEIHAMSVRYRLALFGCKGQDYADLFATPGGYFGSGSRGEVRERQALIEMVSGYDRCSPPPTQAQIDREAPPVAGQPGSPFPAPKIEAAPEGARARIVNSKGGGYYDDVYVRTPKGWRFRSRNVVSDAELAAGLTTADFIAIRALAGDDHGYYEDLYGKSEQEIGPRSGAGDKRPFRSSGLRLTAVPGGVKGIAYLRNNGGRYEDLYVTTPAGWRIKERKYVADGRPGELRVMATAAIRTPLEAVRAEVQKAVGRPLVIEYGSARGNLKDQILAGQPFEVALLLPDVDEQLVKQGKIAAGSVVIARVPVAIGQRGDAPRADLSTPAALKAAMLKAKSLRWSPTGAALLTVDKILDTLGIRQAVMGKHNLPGTVLLGPGEFELNIYPLSEILDNKALTNLGPVIPELQAPAVITAVVSRSPAAAESARAFIGFLQGPALDPALKASGMTR